MATPDGIDDSGEMRTQGVRIDPEFQRLIPPLRAEERSQLEANIIADGVRDPLVTWNGVLVDGHNRYEIATRLGLPYRTVEHAFATRDDAILWVVMNQFGRRNLPIPARVELAMRIEPILAAKARANQVASGGDRTSEAARAVLPNSGEPLSPVVPVKTESEAASLAGVGHDTYHKAKTVLTSAPAPLMEQYRAGDISTHQAYQQIKRAEKETTREARRDENRRVIATVPDARSVLTTTTAKFATIVIDPPWDWGDEGDADQLGRARPTYATMTLEELLALPVADIADVDAHIYLWITNRSLPKGFALLERWGFRYITCLTWVKPSFGMGNYFRGQTEQILFGVKGIQLLKRKDVGTVLSAPRGPQGHSSKPSAFYALFESCSPGPYVEMFARQARDGWSIWGETSHAD